MSPAGSRVLPSYRELGQRAGAPPGSAWGVFGPDDQLGTAGLLTEECVVRGSRAVRKGQYFNLDWPVNAFNPPTSNLRKLAQHQMFQRHENHRDDYLSDFYLQATTQVDALRHQRHPTYGFYNGVSDDEISVDSGALGIQNWVQSGLVGRGVLLDVEGVLAAEGRRLDYEVGEAFGIDVLEAALDVARLEIETGDILLINTGWCRYYFDELDDAGRAEIAREVRSPGLEQSREVVEWLWDHHVSMVASDTTAVESDPAVESSPFTYAYKGMMHQELIPLLGMCLGELWRLDELAEDCRLDGVYECMVVAKPLNLIGGVGSPANAVGLK